MNLVLGKHLRRYRLDPLEGVELCIREPNKLLITYEQQIRPIEFEITYGEHFPFHPPHVQMKYPLWHPNVERGQFICDLFAEQWSPGLTIDKVILSIVSLILTPDPVCSNLATFFFMRRRTKYLEVVQYEQMRANHQWLHNWIRFLWKYFPFPEDILHLIARMITYEDAKQVFLLSNKSPKKRKRVNYGKMFMTKKVELNEGMD